MNGTVALGLLLTGAGLSESPKAAQIDFPYPQVTAHVPAGLHARAVRASPYNLIGLPRTAGYSQAVRPKWSTGYPGPLTDPRVSAYLPVERRAPSGPALEPHGVATAAYEPPPATVPPPEPTPAAEVTRGRAEPIVRLTDARAIPDTSDVEPPPLEQTFEPEPLPPEEAEVVEAPVETEVVVDAPAEAEVVVDAPVEAPVPPPIVVADEAPAAPVLRTPVEPEYGPGELWEVIYETDPETGGPVAKLVKRETPLPKEPEPEAGPRPDADAPWKTGPTLPGTAEEDLWLEKLP